jgi:hypothetical protein
MQDARLQEELRAMGSRFDQDAEEHDEEARDNGDASGANAAVQLELDHSTQGGGSDEALQDAGDASTTIEDLLGAYAADVLSERELAAMARLLDA